MARRADPTQGLTSRINRTLLAVLAMVSLALILLWRIDNPRVERLRIMVADRLSPVLALVSQPIERAASLIRDGQTLLDVHAQNRALRREIQWLRTWRETARQLEEENAQLRALNNVRLAQRTAFVTADVIADSGGPFRETVLVNVGHRDGVLDGAAAVDGFGLVGRVVGLGERAARVLLLTDFSSRVPVVILPAARRAILSGDGTAAPKLEFIDGPDRVSPGDLIETSGEGGIFPPNLPVGTVIQTPAGLWRAKLATNYARLEFVRLLRYQPDTAIDRPGGLILPPPAAAPPETPPASTPPAPAPAPLTAG